MNQQRGGPFLPADRTARWAQGFLTASLALAVAGTVSTLVVMIAPGAPFADGELDLKQLLQALVGLLQVLVWIGTVIAFLMWFYRVHKNLPAMGARNLEYSPGWAVGGFFVPFLNLARPLQVMREVWHWSDPSGYGDDPLPRNLHATPPVIGWWWACFLLSSFASNISARIEFSGTSSPDLVQDSNVFSIVANVFDFPAALLAVKLVGNITKWQLERYNQVQQGSAGAAASATQVG